MEPQLFRLLVKTRDSGKRIRLRENAKLLEQGEVITHAI